MKKTLHVLSVLLLAVSCCFASTSGPTAAVSVSGGTNNNQLLGVNQVPTIVTWFVQFTDNGSANAYAGSMGSTSTVTTNSIAFMNPAHTNTSASTLNITALGSKSITKCGTTALVAGDIVASVPAILVYDGTEYQLINPQAVGCPAQDSGTARGVATLSSGTATVSTSAACTVGSTCTYQLTNCGPAGTLGVTLAIGTQTPGTSFVINSLTAGSVVTTDTSVVCWRIN